MRTEEQKTLRTSLQKDRTALVLFTGTRQVFNGDDVDSVEYHVIFRTDDFLDALRRCHSTLTKLFLELVK
jgi:hypothetical protein